MIDYDFYLSKFFVSYLSIFYLGLDTLPQIQTSQRPQNLKNQKRTPGHWDELLTMTVYRETRKSGDLEVSRLFRETRVETYSGPTDRGLGRPWETFGLLKPGAVSLFEILNFFSEGVSINPLTTENFEMRYIASTVANSKIMADSQSKCNNARCVSL